MYLGEVRQVLESLRPVPVSHLEHWVSSQLPWSVWDCLNNGSRYRNSETAEAFLADSPGRLDLRPILRYLDGIVYPRWEKFAEAIRTDQGQPQFSKFTTHQQQMFSAAVEVFSAPGAVALAGSYDFGRHHRLLDIAGGTGSFLIAVLQHSNALKGTLFELPEECAVAIT